MATQRKYLHLSKLSLNQVQHIFMYIETNYEAGSHKGFWENVHKIVKLQKSKETISLVVKSQSMARWYSTDQQKIYINYKEKMYLDSSLSEIGKKWKQIIYNQFKRQRQHHILYLISPTETRLKSKSQIIKRKKLDLPGFKVVFVCLFFGVFVFAYFLIHKEK